jgi:hypothetical protein
MKQYYKKDIMARCRESVFPAVFEPEHGDLVVFCVGNGSLKLGRLTSNVQDNFKLVERISAIPKLSPFAAIPKTSSSFFEYRADSSFIEVLTYRFADEDMNAMCRALPLENLREMFDLEDFSFAGFTSGARRSWDEPVRDFAGNLIQVGDMVAFSHGSTDLKIGRVIALDEADHKVMISSATWTENSYQAVESWYVCVLQNSEENKKVIANMTNAEIMDFYSAPKMDASKVGKW